MSRPAIDIPIGSRFGRLVVVGRAPSRISPSGRKKGARWECLCDCGVSIVVDGAALRNGSTKSCGCLWRETITKHGKSGNAPEYHAWTAMRQRCANPKSPYYDDYGGRGITVCERWCGQHGFENFIKDMGLRPSSKHSIDRYPNRDGNYEPQNCRWATQFQQKNNTRRNLFITANGETHTLAEWSRVSGIKAITIKGRLLRGWSPSRATTV